MTRGERRKGEKILIKGGEMGRKMETGKNDK